MNEDSGDNIALRSANFCTHFLRARGAIQLLVIACLLSLSIGSVLGVVPVVMSDRYARLYHGWTGPDCASLDTPVEACTKGSDDAQAAATWSNLAMNVATLFFSSIVGSMSDVRGRRIFVILGLFLYGFYPAMLLLTQYWERMDPLWYYSSFALVGLVNILSIIFAAIPDITPEEFRTATYGLLSAIFFGAVTLAPSLCLVLTHFQTSMVSFGSVVLAFLFAILTLPETLSTTVVLVAAEEEEHESLSSPVNQASPSGSKLSLFHIALRPLREMSILIRSRTMILISLASFFSGMVSASDTTMILYYIEQHLGVNDQDVAALLFINGVANLVVQGAALQPMIRILGEKGLLMLSFIAGMVHNGLYGLARDKQTIYVAFSLGALTKTNVPILSSLASKSASPTEQGRVQGAMFALGALANAIGPVAMELIYSRTGNSWFGPGTMFLFASFLNVIGCVIVCFIPVEPSSTCQGADSADSGGDLHDSVDSSLEEPFLDDDDADRIPQSEEQ